jgi:hypothetical protein
VADIQQEEYPLVERMFDHNWRSPLAGMSRPQFPTHTCPYSTLSTLCCVQNSNAAESYHLHTSHST